MSIEIPKIETKQDEVNERFPVLKVKPGSGFAGHNQSNIEIHHFDPKVRDIIRNAFLENRTDQPVYALRKKAGAFLQGDQEGWLFVEFWNDDPQSYQPFVDYLNEQIAAERRDKK